MHPQAPGKTKVRVLVTHTTRTWYELEVDKSTHRRAILIRIEDDGTGPTINAYPELIDVRGFTITSDTPAATLHLKYEHITSHEALTKLLQDALEEEA